MFIKICGLRRLGDARLAAAAGATALGFVFAPSRRQVDAGTVQWIVSQLPPEVITVGVFMNQSPGTVGALAAASGISAIQLHGLEAAEDYRNIGLPIVQRIEIRPGDSVEAVESRMKRSTADVLLIDPGAGEGAACHWPLLADLKRPFVLAGGLTPDNCRTALTQSGAAGVDVASGVELAPGIKDSVKVKQFIKESRCFAQTTRQRAISMAMADALCPKP